MFKVFKQLVLSALLFLSIVDVSYQQKLGDRRETTGCFMRAEASWKGSFFNPCKRGSGSSKCIYNPVCGWAIVNYKPVITSKTAGSYSASLISGQADFTQITTQEASQYFLELVSAAAQLKLGDMTATLAQQGQETVAEYDSFYNNGVQSLSASAKTTAQGSCVDRKRGWIEMHFDIEEQYIGCTVSDLTSELESDPDFVRVKELANA